MVTAGVERCSRNRNCIFATRKDHRRDGFVHVVPVIILHKMEVDDLLAVVHDVAISTVKKS